MSSKTRRERFTVEYDGEEVEVTNSARVTVQKEHHVVAAREHETFEAPNSPKIVVDGFGGTPDYVTEQLAQYLWGQFDIDLDEHDIEVVDIDSDEVTVL